jgi:hypothetical protein
MNENVSEYHNGMRLDNKEREAFCIMQWVLGMPLMK